MFPYRISGQKCFFSRKITDTLLISHSNGVDESPQKFICKTRYRILFQDHGRYAFNMGRQQHACRCVTSHTYNKSRPYEPDDTVGIKNRQEKNCKRFYFPEKRFSDETLSPDKFYRIAFTRNYTRLYSMNSPDKEYISGKTSPPELFRCRNPGEEMPPGTAACNDNFHYRGPPRNPVSRRVPEVRRFSRLYQYPFCH